MVTQTTNHCRIYGQVAHSNPDMDSVEDLVAEFMFKFPFIFASEKKLLKIFTFLRFFFSDFRFQIAHLL